MKTNSSSCRERSNQAIFDHIKAKFVNDLQARLREVHSLPEAEKEEARKKFTEEATCNVIVTR